MGFLDWLFRPASSAVASPWTTEPSHLESVTFQELFPDIDAENLPISREMAMQIPAIARARNLICTGIGRMPLHAMKADGPLSSQPPVVQQPDPEQPAFMSWSWIVDELMFHGKAYLYAVEQDGDRATRLRPLPQTRIDFDESGEPIGYNGLRYPNRWVRIDGPHEGILAFGRQSLRSAHALELAYRRSASMPVPMIDLHQTTATPKLAKDERAAIINSWVAARRSKTGAVAFTTHNIEAKPMGMPAEQLLIAARNAAALDMARLCGVSAWAVDASVQGSSLTYSNLVDRNRELIDYSFMPYMAAIEARLSLDDVLPRGTWCRFSTNDWLRGDLKYRAEAYKAAKDAGLMTDEQIQDAERGLPTEG